MVAVTISRSVITCNAGIAVVFLSLLFALPRPSAGLVERTRYQRRSPVPFREMPLTLCLGVKLRLCRRSSVASLHSDVPGFSPLYSRTAGMFETAPFRLTANLLKLGKASEQILDMSNRFSFSSR
jgi:hypothetical protein